MNFVNAPGYTTSADLHDPVECEKCRSQMGVERYPLTGELLCITCSRLADESLKEYQDGRA